ncbi:MAG: PQQ-binding-like beta-propeller repeat protein [Streptosporangiaceae bacterium]
MRNRLMALITLALALALGACSSAKSTPVPPVAGRAPAADWPQYHGNGARTGELTGLPPAGRLTLAWTTQLGAAVYGQPLIIGSTVIAATESDQVYGLDRATGAVRWRTRVGTPLPGSQQPCGDISPLGITSTPVYDQQTGLVYVVAQNGRTGHLLTALRVADGHAAFRRNVPSPDRNPAYDQQRGALALADGHIYVAFGGHYGDCGPYIGSVVALPATGRGATWSYRVPTKSEGGIWAAGGPVVSNSGTVYVSVGNGAATSPPYDGSDAVLALTPRLKRTGFFAPTGWAAENRSDLDLGAMSPALLPDGRILQVGKDGTGYLLAASHLGGIGGQLAAAQVCPAFGGAAVSGTTVYVPCNGSGLTAVRTTRTGLLVGWHGPAGAWGSPVVGGGAVWVADWNSGTLYELAAPTGKVAHKISLGGPLPHFASPSLSGRLILVGTMTGVTAIVGA